MSTTAGSTVAAGATWAQSASLANAVERRDPMYVLRGRDAKAPTELPLQRYQAMKHVHVLEELSDAIPLRLA